MKLTKIMEREGVSYQKILMPKNSGLNDLAIDPYNSLGIEKREESKYVDAMSKVEVQKCRGEDIPALCDMYTRERSIPVLGVTGDDLVDEYRLKGSTCLRVLDTIDWICRAKDGVLYSRPTLCLISAAKPLVELSSSRVVVNQKYAIQSRAYLEEMGYVQPVRVVSGDVENEIPENADFGIEIVLSGRTLGWLDKERKVRRNPPLYVVKELRQSDISVISSWPMPDLDAALRLQYEKIEERRKNPSTSLTSRLLSDGNLLVKKIGEEWAELVQGIARADRENVLEESQQSLWLLQVALSKSGISWDEFLKYAKEQ
jgi:phosphoribosyl-ATP pyrophosphohydrolase